jgi:hypothetical protein
MLLRTTNKNNYEPSIKKKENNLDKTKNSESMDVSVQKEWKAKELNFLKSQNYYF